MYLPLLKYSLVRPEFLPYCRHFSHSRGIRPRPDPCLQFPCFQFEIEKWWNIFTTNNNSLNIFAVFFFDVKIRLFRLHKLNALVYKCACVTFMTFAVAPTSVWQLHAQLRTLVQCQCTHTQRKNRRGRDVLKLWAKEMKFENVFLIEMKAQRFELHIYLISFFYILKSIRSSKLRNVNVFVDTVSLSVIDSAEYANISKNREKWVILFSSFLSFLASLIRTGISGWYRHANSSSYWNSIAPIVSGARTVRVPIPTLNTCIE